MFNVEITLGVSNVQEETPITYQFCSVILVRRRNASLVSLPTSMDGSTPRNACHDMTQDL